VSLVVTVRGRDDGSVASVETVATPPDAAIDRMECVANQLRQARVEPPGGAWRVTGRFRFVAR
jgi:hypothetical protein